MTKRSELHAMCTHITDDQIVDAIAKYGAEGIKLRDLGDVTKSLGLEGERASSAIEERMYDLYFSTDRLTRPNGDDAYALTWKEWGRRLAGQTAEHIAAALGGEPCEGGSRMNVLHMYKVMVGNNRMGGLHEWPATAQPEADKFNATNDRYRAEVFSCFVLQVPQPNGRKPLLFELGMPVPLHEPREENAESATNQEPR